MLGDFKLTDNGITLTYLYKINESVKNCFNRNNMEFRQFNNSDAGVMISHK